MFIEEATVAAILEGIRLGGDLDFSLSGCEGALQTRIHPHCCTRRAPTTLPASRTRAWTS